MPTTKIIHINERSVPADPKMATVTLTLNFELRQKSRLRTTLDNGLGMVLSLPRGTVLRDGQCLCAEDGTAVLIKAAVEPVMKAYTTDPMLLACACYHVGSRRIPLQISTQWIRYRPNVYLDKVLSDMGLAIKSENATFEPEIVAEMTGM